MQNGALVWRLKNVVCLISLTIPCPIQREAMFSHSSLSRMYREIEILYLAHVQYLYMREVVVTVDSKRFARKISRGSRHVVPDQLIKPTRTTSSSSLLKILIKSCFLLVFLKIGCLFLKAETVKK